MGFRGADGDETVNEVGRCFRSVGTGVANGHVTQSCVELPVGLHSTSLAGMIPAIEQTASVEIRAQKRRIRV